MEAFIQQGIAKVSHLPPASHEWLRENARLQWEYPDEYVAYIDHWKGRGRAIKFSRELLAHSKELPPVAAAIIALPAKLRKRARLEYVTDPYAEVMMC